MKRVLVVGGSEEFPGAVYLAAISALRSGAGSVIVMSPEKAAWTLNALSPDLITKKLPGKRLSPEHLPQILRQLKTADILLIGNGATTEPGAASLMRALMRWKGSKVIDADALKVLRRGVEDAILTPNTGEWALLEKNIGTRKLLSRNVIVKKGMPTSVHSGTRQWRQKRTNLGLQKAGTGDVLAGMCAGFLAQGLLPFEAAKRAAETGNAIADILTKRKKGYYFLASDIAEEEKRILRIWRRKNSK
jgi:NAD(P)H-hydrate epimerase